MQSVKKTPTKAPVQKKKPGRPRKNPIREHGPRLGVAKEPQNSANRVEFEYDEPSIFKKLWMYAKNMAMESMQIIFRPDEVIFFGVDHSQKSRMRVRIDANKINHYYCDGTVECGIANKSVEPIMTAIDESYNKIIINVEAKNAHKNIKIVLCNDIEIDERRRIDLDVSYTPISDEEQFVDTDYSLKFELPGKYFKKMLTNVRLFSDQIAIRQDGPNDPLIFEHKNTLKRICSKNVVRNGKKIKLQSNLDENDTFLSCFKIDYIKPISAALSAENITIWAHEQKPLCFIVTFDSCVVEVKILTDVIKSVEV